MKNDTVEADAGGMGPRSGQNGNSMKLAGLVIGVLLVAGLALWLFLRRPATGDSLPRVNVSMVDTARIEVFDEYDGSIRARQSVEVTARVEGVLEKMLFKEGSLVNKGQTLFVIDPKLYQARVDRARAEFNRAVALKDKAVRDLNRIRPLFAQKAASQLDLDNAEAALECAEAEVEISRVDLLEAQLTLGYTRVVAPISGYISERMVDVGALVGPGTRPLLATIVRSDTVTIDFSMTSLEYMRSKDRDVNIRCEDDGECLDKLPSFVTVMLSDGTEYPYPGKVDFADPVVDPKSGTFSVRAEMPNPDGRLLPGEDAKVRVLLDIVYGGMTVPADAVRVEDDEKVVYVVSHEGAVERRVVIAGDKVGKRIIIKGGLDAGEMVAVDQFSRLADGVKVIPVAIPGSESGAKSPSEDRK